MGAHIKVAEQFGKLIGNADYVAAHSLLTKEAQAVYSPENFKESVVGMTTYGPGPIQEVEVMEEFILEDWPDKQNGDIAIVYISLAGAEFNEAVTVTLVHEAGGVRIRHLEWGRP